MKFILVVAMMIACATNSQAAVILKSGESYSGTFELDNTPNSFKLSDFWWDAILEIVDSAAPPFQANSDPGQVTLTIFENMDYTNPIYTASQNSDNWLSDYGLFFGSDDFLAGDKNGSFTVSYAGNGEATFYSIAIANFAGDLAPSNVARTLIFPEANGNPPNPVNSPSMIYLMLSFLALVVTKRALIKN